MSFRIRACVFLASAALVVSACSVFEDAVGGLRNIVDENRGQPRFGYATGPEAPVVVLAAVTRNDTGLTLATEPLGLARAQILDVAVSPDNTMVGGTWANGEGNDGSFGIFVLEEAGDFAVREGVGTITLDSELACLVPDLNRDAARIGEQYLIEQLGADAAMPGNFNVTSRLARSEEDVIRFSGWRSDNSFSVNMFFRVAVDIEVTVPRRTLELPVERQPTLNPFGRYAPAPSGGWVLDACPTGELPGAPPPRTPVRDMRVAEDGDILLDDSELASELVAGRPLERRTVMLLDGPY